MASLSNLSNSYHSAAAHLKNAQAWLLSLSGSSITSVNDLLASIPNALAGNGSTSKERAEERVRLAEQRSVERLSSRDPSQELSPLVKKAGAIAMAAGVYYVGNKAADQLAAMVEAIPSRLNFQTPGDECLIEKIENPGVKPRVDAEKAQSRPKKSEGKQRQAMAPLPGENFEASVISPGQRGVCDQANRLVRLLRDADHEDFSLRCDIDRLQEKKVNEDFAKFFQQYLKNDSAAAVEFLDDLKGKAAIALRDADCLEDIIAKIVEVTHVNFNKFVNLKNYKIHIDEARELANLAIKFYESFKTPNLV